MSEAPEHIIQAICNNPRHARNKVAKIARFGRFTFPNGEVRWLIWDPNRETFMYTVRPDATVEAHGRYGAESEMGSTYTWPCKLCKRSLKVREGTLQERLERIYQEGLPENGARQHVSRISLDRFSM
jgi:hypothetical protein